MKRTVGIVGLGLVGGSVARRVTELGGRCVAYDADPTVREAARQAGLDVVDMVADLADFDVTILAAPTPVATAMLRSGSVPPGDGLIIDVCSTKTDTVAAADTGGLGDRFVGAHPMAGKADSGFEHSEAGLLVGATWVLTPGASTQSGRVLEAVAFIDAVFGSPALVTTPSVHDAMVARTSHLPHVLGQALIHSLGEDTPLAAALAAGSFDGATRVVRGSPTFPSELVWANRDRAAGALTELIADLTCARDILEIGEKASLDAWFAQSDLDDDRTETITIPALRDGRELDELVAFGEAGWLVRSGAPGELVLGR